MQLEPSNAMVIQTYHSKIISTGTTHSQGRQNKFGFLTPKIYFNSYEVTAILCRHIWTGNPATYKVFWRTFFGKADWCSASEKN